MVSENRTPAPEALRIANAWQNSAQTLFASYGDTLRRLTEFSAAFWQPQTFNRGDVRQAIERITASTRDVTNAQVAVAGELLRAPFWLTGAASPVDLQARYAQLFDAQRELVQAYLDALLGWQRAMTGATEQATQVVREAVDSQTLTARAVANTARETQQATIDATRNTAQAVQETVTRTAEVARDTTNRAVEQAREVVRETAQQAELALRPIKGTIRGEEKIYHLPGQSSYERTEADQTFATEEEARNAGFRRAQTPGGGRIKGNINREGERIYHLPGQANYDRVEAEFLFESEEQAQAAGFRASQR